MGIFEGIDPAKVGGVGGALIILAGLLYAAWQRVKQDGKGDNVDARVNQFTSQLQAQLDKAIARADTLQVAYNQLQVECAKTAAQLAATQTRAEFLAAENQRLQQDLQVLRQRLSSGAGS